MGKVAFHTLGCKVNQYETDAMLQLFENNGYKVIPFNEVSDIYIINTCTVTNMADKKSRQIINKAKKTNPDSIIVVVGCYAQAAKEKLELDKDIDIVIGNNKKNDILNIVEDYIKEKKIEDTVIDINDTDIYEPLSITKVSEKTRAYIKIQDGCNQFCSYCIIPFMRGRVRSRLPEEVIKEVEALVKNGYKEVVLTGIHLASYGKDLVDIHILDLLKELNKIQDLKRIRLGSLEPNLITEEFAKEVSSIEKLCPHFHLSLQSGCNETLKRMNRKYTTESYLDKVEILRKYYNKPAITTDIIVGFPGETEEEFNETYEFTRKISFSDVHVFKYSKREGTKAADFTNQVEEKVKTFRSNKLIQCCNALKEKYLEDMKGEIEEVLFEETITIDDKDYCMGHTKRYVKVGIISDEDISNQLINVELLERKDDLLFGRKQ
ncbi:threonylcarbamoyladenosine tRNA methylthiotransferase MtaB [Natranaerovirga pectinivora]|uniref:Threonylcarbamoyladenosine tRNA methylthiotransferase MtaB n=1 Tax=Natranaerovirga pectinivora TaxID=682400 RepID=A0A4R3MPV3_9FIRM|nr:tRNA (N(6)-L-threonylcarbamoyladenosine(37)-C(2))-methylthiotransferase MtaB [Natranaerovirga pectinivora]TCT16882.1 threonylcarbamoyladenosine tRNA methylthiotransferase MtaB [Natranaerovirga pectinivora]